MSHFLDRLLFFKRKTETFFDTLAGFAGKPECVDEIRQQAANEGEDDTLVNMDEIWEEDAVSFMGSGESCTTQTATVSPVTITSRDEFLKQRL